MDFLCKHIRPVIEAAKIPRNRRLLQFPLYDYPVSPLPACSNRNFTLSLQLNLYSNKLACCCIVAFAGIGAIDAISTFAGIGRIGGIGAIYVLRRICCSSTFCLLQSFRRFD
ncbi:hypothetical protein D3C73_1081280 [compost metagenome]